MRKLLRGNMGSVRFGWKLLCVILAGMVMNVVINGVMSLKVGEKALIPNASFTAYFQAPSLYFAISVIAGVCLVEKRKLRTIGLPGSLSGLLQSTAGGILGAMCCIAAFLVLGAVGIAHYPEGWFRLDWGRLNFAMIVTGSLFPAVGEELFFRGYALEGMVQAWGSRAAVPVSALLFSLMHSANSGITAIALLNLWIFGCFLALVRVRGCSLWYAIGFHFAWNLVQGSLYDSVVSGDREGGLIRVQLTGQPIWSGGAFGIEASLLVTVLLSALTGAALWRSNQASCD
ncbi:CPBP family intramembrane glutamic endopeptidase [Paenibacillus sp. NFR01]|uniref:CPBP family intramembrane glutamic endopeptidase n=1 Tax=Paenibacillus sp. NFR01 TaxID=1566279 RepID=UPI0008C7FDA1|nr:type II CAAX endopeptidase family protein [Paenibacillus sp. NFR01]SET24444.1 hypothetical protein SAMN03159358_1112 [Paenibacillus sp. NFR01]